MFPILFMVVKTFWNSYIPVAEEVYEGKKRSIEWFFGQHLELLHFDAKFDGRYCVLIEIAKLKLILEGEENCFEKNAHPEQVLRWILHKGTSTLCRAAHSGTGW